MSQSKGAPSEKFYANHPRKSRQYGHRDVTQRVAMAEHAGTGDASAHVASGSRAAF